ncbi:hypothetical protein F5B21DRAFT_470190 [Xylaria acuta]|nr:hypothetical protein F5B21DRAFT_470190 [Xylaria acuta]
MASSRDAVLQTAELLQEILLQLDLRTLLTTAQLVSRQWHELITSSPALKQALYFEPIVRPSGPATHNPLLAEVFPPWFPKQTKDEQPDVTKPPKMINREDFGSLPMAQASRRHAFMHPDATWRRMLVQQPPVLRLGRWTASHAMMGDFHHFPLQEFPDGLRMGSLYDLAQDWVRQAVSGFNVFWDPSVATTYGSTRYGRGMEPGKKDELESFASQASVVLFCYMVVQCTEDWPDVQFEEAFTFTPSKEQRAYWHFLRASERKLLVAPN